MAEFDLEFWVRWAAEWRADGIDQAVVCPGSRSAPLLQAMLVSGWRLHSCVDERSAGYQALGMAEATRRPVVVLTTSGTAAANLAPAMCEAYFSGVPLVAWTADRPPEWIGQEDNQAIHQPSLFGAHTRGAWNLPVLTDDPMVRWHTERAGREARRQLRRGPRGPVHLNIPFREPLYAEASEVSAHPGPVASWSFEENRNSLRNSREIAYERPLVLVGRDDPFEHVTIPPNVATVGDVLSRSVTRVPSEAWLGVLARHPELRPDAVVTMGGAFVSKTLRQILRTWEFTHLHYGSTEAEVFARSVIETDVFPAASASWANQWRSVIERAEAMTASFWQSDVPFEFVAVRAVMESCNGADTLHLGNSLAVRIAGLVPSIPAGLPIFCNRGTSGIDGSLSTAVGHAIATPGVRHTVLLGDLAFFYDRNALWRDGLPGRLRVVILNNGEGAIFRALEGPARWGDALTRWTTPHRRTAEWTAHDHGLHYRPVRNVKELAEAVSSENQDGPELIEVFTDPQETAAGFRRAIQFFREHTPL